MQKNTFMQYKKKRQISFVEAIREGITQSLQKDKKLFLMGEGVDDAASMWGTIRGISKEFGKKRVLEMPVAENGLIGAAIGCSIAGSKVLVNLQRVEFSLYAFEQIVNNAAKSLYISRGKHNVPIVIRLVVGRGWGQGPEHAQSMENIFSSIPGLKVVMPTFPNEAKELMINSLFDKNPVIFIEHRWLHYSRGEVDKKFNISTLKSITKINSGKDITIISNSINTLIAKRVVDTLKLFNIKVDLLNLVSPNPLNLEEVFKSVKKTKNILTIDLGHKTLGLGGEIIAQIVEKNIRLKSSPVRMGLPFHPAPSSMGMIKDYYPDGKKMLLKIKEMLKINDYKFKMIMEAYNKNSPKIPIDVPDPYFKGPF